MNEIIIGKYIRLSQADMDLNRREGKTESESITHQRELIQEFIDGRPEFSGCRQYEFYDDGYSGTNFDRPSFEQLIEKIRRREINCVIVKDFSRFGRSYIELGDYLERIFPFMGVRFISINDQYDSDDYKGTTGGLDVAMKNIVYDYYSKDLSTKVTTAKYAKMRRGEYIGGHVPYGLRKDPSAKGKLVIDEEAAAVVRRIFALALEGKGTGDIAGILNADGVETRAQYYRRKHPDTGKYPEKGSDHGWTVSAVEAVLHQEMYYGAVVGHKRAVAYPCGKSTQAVPRDEQFIVEGMHEAIVSKEDWTAAQAAIHKVSASKTKAAKNYLLRKTARCGCCKRALQYYDMKKGRYYKCDLSRHERGSKCWQGKLMADPVEEAVTAALKALFNSVDTLKQEARRQQGDAKDALLAAEKQIRDLQRDLEKVEAGRFQNVDSFMSGRICREEYLSRRKALTEEADRIHAEMDDLEQKHRELQTSGAAQSPEIEKFLKDVDRFSKQEITNETVRAFIKDVLVYEPGRIEIIWNFSDEVAGMLEE